MIKILVLIDYSTEFSRRFLKGVIQYAKQNVPWIVYRLPVYYKSLYGNRRIKNIIKEWQPDGIIVQWGEDINFFESFNIPVFFQNYTQGSQNLSNITGGYFETGKMAANFFIERRYENFAFYGNKGFIWSIERAEGFKERIETVNGKFFYFETESLSGEQWSESHIELEDWLLALPKPIALFACDDSFALQVSEICKINNISIPEEIALLGVDNDELICELSNPSISSIVLTAEKGGYEVAKQMHQSIKMKTNKKFDVIIDPVRIELRQSTERYNIGNKYISEVVDYIRNNLASELSIAVIAREVPLSRRSLEMKFKSEMGISIYQFLLNQRLDNVAYLLQTTNKSLLEISLECGFNDTRTVYRIFKKEKGLTPMEYRNKFAGMFPVF